MSETVDTDLSALSFWSKPRDERDAAFAHLRTHDPVSWQRQPESVLIEQTSGYWAVVGYEDIRAVSRAADVFGSAEGITLEDTPPEFLEAAQSIIAMDNPRHAAVRGLVQKAFTPRNVRRLEEGIRADAVEVLDRLDDVEEGDFVPLVAKWLPLMTIMRMLGVPEAEQENLVHHADSMVSWNDPDYLQGRDPVAVIGEAIMVLHGAAQQLAAAREAEPEDDLLTALVQAEVDGEKLTHAEIGSFFVLLTVAGNDTTRHATSHTAVALTRFRDQRDVLLADPESALGIAVEEFVRWSSPVMTMRRTTRKDTTIGSTEVAEGDKVVLFYPSGNRDERAFPDPTRFDVTRDPNRHLGFGGGGAHYCLGASLARTQLRAVFGELLRRYPDFEVGGPHYLVGNFVDGVSGLDFRPRAPRGLTSRFAAVAAGTRTTMNRKLLGIYLNDHLAGATAGRDLAARAAGANRGTDYGTELEALAGEIAEDRAALEELMERLDVGVDRLKVAAAWAGEKAGRLKLNGSLTSYSPLSRLVELEGLALGVSGKQSLWKNLESVAGQDPVLTETDLAGLAERAQSQLDRLEPLRHRAAAEALA